MSTSVQPKLRFVGNQITGRMASINRNNISGIKLFQIWAFVAVAEHQRFSEAALQLELTQSSISHEILLPDLRYEGSRRLQLHLDRYAPSLNVAYEINEDSIQVAMVQQGLGAAILPHLSAMPIPPEIRVYPLPMPFRRILGATIAANTLHTPATSAFWDLLRS